MNYKPNNSVVNTLTGEVGVVVTTHTYPATDTGSLAVEVVSVKFSGNDTAKWVVADCLKKL